jgi:cullin-4
MPPSNPPPVDISVRPPRSQSKRKNCDPENPEGATVTKAKLQSTILDTLSQSKRLKPNCSSHSLKSLLTMNKNISTFGDPKGAKFQAHTGAKKLVIKNLRVKPRENLVRFYASIFSQLKSAVQAILQEKQPPQPLERLYRDVEDICRNGQADALYKDLHEQCELHLQSGPRALISNGAVVAQPIDVLRTVRTHWQNWIGQVVSSTKTNAWQLLDNQNSLFSPTDANTIHLWVS